MTYPTMVTNSAISGSMAEPNDDPNEPQRKTVRQSIIDAMAAQDEQNPAKPKTVSFGMPARPELPVFDSPDQHFQAQPVHFAVRESPLGALADALFPQNKRVQQQQPYQQPNPFLNGLMGMTGGSPHAQNLGYAPGALYGE